MKIMKTSATDERNFRSTYYEKVGCRSVEEKKSFEILLKDNPLNLTKLKNFCLRFVVPTVYRELLWCLLLGVTPLFNESRDFVKIQRLAVYEDLLKALRIIRVIDDKTPKSKVFLAMSLLERRQLNFGYNINNENHFTNVIEILLHTFKNSVEIYWISKKLYDFSLEINRDYLKLQEQTLILLEKEDNEIFMHLKDNDILSNLPLEKWYSSFFAGVLHERALIKIWDKICCGSKKILIILFLMLINTLWRRMIKKHKNVDGFLEGINYIKDDQEISDQIVNNAIERWELLKEQL